MICDPPADCRHYLLAVAAPAGPAKYANIEIDKIHRYVDRVSVVAHDFYGLLQRTDELQSPSLPFLLGSLTDWALLRCRSERCLPLLRLPPEKPQLGLPFYGRLITMSYGEPNVPGAAGLAGGLACDTGLCYSENRFLLPAEGHLAVEVTQ